MRPLGARSQSRTAAERSGSAVSYVAASRAIRRRDVAESAMTSNRLTDARANHARWPAQAPAALSIQAVEHRLRVSYGGLDLDDKQSGRFGVECQDIDGASLAPDRERDL